jgi:ankyrin repeat protein
LNTRNLFIISLNKKLSSLSFEEREKRIEKVLSSVDKSDIFTPLDSIDEDYFDEELNEETEAIEPKELPLSPFESSKSRYGRSPLHEAIIAGDLVSIKSFLTQKLYLTDKDNNNVTPLGLAKMEESKEILDLFYEFGYE